MADPDAAASGAALAVAAASLLAPAAGAAEAVAAELSVELVELDVSAGFEQPVASNPPSAAAAISVNNLDCMDAPLLV